MQSGGQEFWRVVNADANTILDLQVRYDGVPQPLQIAAFDGVPTGSKDGHHQGTLVTQTDILLMPSGRAEFIVAAPPSGVHRAQLVTLTIDGGAASDVNPYRPYANILTTTAPVHLQKLAVTGPARKMRFDDLANAKIETHRDLYFSEYFQAFGFHEKEAATFFITVDGQKETLFDANNPPAITTTQGAVEEWRIENRTSELHAFHMHQIHFLVTAINDVPIEKDKQQLYDVFPLGYWSGRPIDPYPSVTVKLDFRGPTVGDFVYHCHILDHEDFGMMAIIRVLPPDPKHAKLAQKADHEAGGVGPRSAWLL
jgi:FtsP/CotA-like multicopper oxidase with cupredoxin domain